MAKKNALSAINKNKPTKQDQGLPGVGNSIVKEKSSVLERGIKTLKRTDAILGKNEGSLAKQEVLEAPADKFVVFKYNARAYDELTIEKCADVIESIKANDQQVPAIVRKGDNGILEVIAGSRRLFSAGHLGIPLKYLLIEANNKQAFQISTLENEKRKDTSAWEKYESYQEIIEKEYGGIQKEFAIDNNISETKLSRIMSFGKIDSEILDTYGSRENIPLEHPQEIGRLIKNGVAVEKALIKESRKISSEQYEITPDQVLTRLRTAANDVVRAKAASSKKIAKPIFNKESFGKAKKGSAEIKITPTKITTIRLNKDAWESKEDAIKAVTKLLEESFGDN